MAVTREQFDSGLTYDAYKAQMTRNKEQLEQNEKDLQPSSASAQGLSSLPQTINVVALAEDGARRHRQPAVIGGIARLRTQAQLRVHLRDQRPGETIMDEHLNNDTSPSHGHFPDRTLTSGRLGRRLTCDQTSRREAPALYQQHPGATRAHRRTARRCPRTISSSHGGRTQRDKPFANSEVVRELRELVQGATARQPA
jgi:hypothetical protein